MRRRDRSETEKARLGFVRPPWQERVQRRFQDYWKTRRENRELPASGDPERAFHEWWERFRAASREMDELTETLESQTIRARVMAAILKPLDIEGPPNINLRATGEDGEPILYPQNPESSGIFRMIVFLKYGITFRELIRQVDIEKSEAAHRKLMAVHRDHWRILMGKRFEDLKLKVGMDHFDIITSGLDFGLGKLTEDELADCLDTICPCLQKHSATYLKKLRTGIKQVCEQLTGETHKPDCPP